MFNLGFTEIVVILVGVAVLFFGGSKITELARGLGRFTGEFKKGKMEMEEEIKKGQDEVK
jgi:sec-independent protein translocase protein TatA